MANGNSAMVREVPEEMSAANAESFFLEVKPYLRMHRPRLVFDCSRVVRLDIAGIAVLLRCLAHAMQLNGDIKLAGVKASIRETLDLSRAGQLFEFFPSTAQAVESFDQRFIGGVDTLDGISEEHVKNSQVGLATSAV